MNGCETKSFDAADAPAAVHRAESMLASPDSNTRWQGAILLGEFCESAPEVIWPTVVQFGSSPDDDLRTAIATCVLEHILEHHFESFFEHSRQLVVAGNEPFTDCLRRCWRFGQAELSPNKQRLDALLN